MLAIRNRYLSWGDAARMASTIPTILWLLYDFLALNNYVNVLSKWNKEKNFEKNCFSWHLEGPWRKEQDPVPEVSGTDPGIRIRTNNVTYPQHYTKYKILKVCVCTAGTWRAVTHHRIRIRKSVVQIRGSGSVPKMSRIHNTGLNIPGGLSHIWGRLWAGRTHGAATSSRPAPTHIIHYTLRYTLYILHYMAHYI